MEVPTEPIATLRGTRVEVDGRRATRLVVVAVLAGLGAASIALLVARAHHYDQLTRLHDHGVVVGVQVSGCLGQLGGSGSNVAGYRCRGALTFDGRTYDVAIPSNALHPPGTTVRAVVDPGEPTLLSTPQAAAEHPSRSTFVLPAILLFVWVIAIGAHVEWRRRSRAATGPPTPAPEA